MQHRQEMAILFLIFIVGLSMALPHGYDFNDPEDKPFQEIDNLGNVGHQSHVDVPTTPPANIMGPTNRTLSQQDSFNLSRDIAIQFVLGKVLRALGPKFEDRLPTAPTNATLTPLNSPLRVETGLCPSRYRRCSSQTFYPSCEIPRNTDEQMWKRRFTLFFNISSEISSIQRSDVLNTTLRLYKNISLPLSKPMALIVKVHAFNRSLKRNRERSVAVASTRVESDYVGWVFINVERLIRRLKGRSNYGVKISVQNEANVPWNIPNLFVKMDCQASNESLVPLPFEVQLDDTAQRYPALNIRSGSQEIFTENNDYLTGYGLQDRVSTDDQFHEHEINNPFPMRVRPQGGWTQYSAQNRFNIYNANQQHLDKILNPHLYAEEEVNQSGVATEDNNNQNSHGVIPGENYESVDTSYLNRPSVPVWSTGSPSYEQSFIQHPRQQTRYKKQSPSPVFSVQYRRTNHLHDLPSHQYHDQRPSSRENVIDESNGSFSSNSNQIHNGNFIRTSTHGQEIQEYDRDSDRDNTENQHRQYSPEYDDEYFTDSQNNPRRMRSHEHHTSQNIRQVDEQNNDNDHDSDDDYYTDFTGHYGTSRFIQGNGNVRSPHPHPHRHNHRQHNRHRITSTKIQQHISDTTSIPDYGADSQSTDLKSIDHHQSKDISSE